MTETQRWIEQARLLLKEIARTKKLAHVVSLQDHMRQLDLPKALCDLGCDDHCEECFWGYLGGYPLLSPCRFAAFQSALKDLNATGTDPAVLRREATALLAVLDDLPKPRPA